VSDASSQRIACPPSAGADVAVRQRRGDLAGDAARGRVDVVGRTGSTVVPTARRGSVDRRDPRASRPCRPRKRRPADAVLGLARAQQAPRLAKKSFSRLRFFRARPGAVAAWPMALALSRAPWPRRWSPVACVAWDSTCGAGSCRCGAGSCCGAARLDRRRGLGLRRRGRDAVHLAAGKTIATCAQNVVPHQRVQRLHRVVVDQPNWRIAGDLRRRLPRDSAKQLALGEPR
jgi:hypothetical protein